MSLIYKKEKIKSHNTNKDEILNFLTLMESIKKHIKGEKFIFDKSGSIFLENLNTLFFQIYI